MEQNIIVPPHEAIFEITSLVVVVQDLGFNPIGLQFVYADLFQSVLHLKGRIQQRMGIPFAFMQWISAAGKEMFDEDMVAQYVMMPHSVIVLTVNENWPPPGFDPHNLLPPPPAPELPPPPPPPPEQQAESTALTYESTSSNDGGNDVVEGGGMHDGPAEVVNGGANLQVCEGCVSVSNKLVDVSSSDIPSDMLDNANISSYLAKLASLADLYANDAFRNAHIAHASTEAVTRFLSPSVAGFLMQKELDYLVGAVQSPERPSVAIVSGSKLSSEIRVIEPLLEKVDVLIISGRMVFTFHGAQNFYVGTSLVEEDKVNLAKSLLLKARARHSPLVLPFDFIVTHKFPFGTQFVYADLYENVLRLKGRIQERIGIPFANQLMLTYRGNEMSNKQRVAHHVTESHSRVNLFTTEYWPTPDYPLNILLPPPPPPPPPGPQEQQTEPFAHDVAGSNDSVNNVVGGDAFHEDPDDPIEVIYGGASLQVCDSCVFVMNKLVTVSRSDMVNLSTSDSIWSDLKENLFHSLGRITMELSEGEFVSTFEFAESGIVKSLLNYFSNGQYLKGKVVEHHGVSDYSLVTVKRLAMFASFSLSAMSLRCEGTRLGFLVSKLKTAVSSLKNFLVIQYQITKSRPTYVAIPTKHAATQFLKEDGEREREIYVMNV